MRTVLFLNHTTPKRKYDIFFNNTLSTIILFNELIILTLPRYEMDLHVYIGCFFFIFTMPCQLLGLLNRNYYFRSSFHGREIFQSYAASDEM
jgi:hypothetical protein